MNQFNKILLTLAAMVALALAPFPTPSQAADQALRVIVHPSNTLEQIDRETLGRIFLKKEERFPSGMKAEPVEIVERTALYEVYVEQIHQSSESRLRRYWVDKMFSGEMMKPRQLGNEDDIVEYVAGNPAAVSVVGDNVRLEGVKQIMVVP